jgi:hypothetical protein
LAILKAFVYEQLPVLIAPCFLVISSQAFSIPYPAFLRIAPATPPPNQRFSLAAFVIASVVSAVMSPFFISTLRPPAKIMEISSWVET